MHDGHQGHQRHQHHGQGAGEVRVEGNVAGHHRRDTDRQHVEVAGGQRVDRGVGAEGVGQQNHECAQQCRGQHRQTDVSPELPAVGPEQGGGLTPVFAQGIEGRVEQQHAQGNLEVGVENDQPGFRVQVEILNDSGLFQHDGEGAVEPQQDDEREGQGHTGEVAGHVGEGIHEVAQFRVDPAQGVGAEHGNDDAEYAGPETDLEAVLDRLQIELRVEDFAEVGQAPTELFRLQAVDHHPEQRGDLEHEEENREGHQAQSGQPFTAGHGIHLSSSRHTGLSWGTPSSSQTVPHSSVCFGAAPWLKLKASPRTNSGTSRSSGSRPLCERSLFMPWSAVTSTWYPASSQPCR
ncbi:hypothetical protein EMIT0180MI3_360030 [Priestia megaterium]